MVIDLVQESSSIDVAWVLLWSLRFESSTSSTEAE